MNYIESHTLTLTLILTSFEAIQREKDRVRAEIRAQRQTAKDLEARRLTEEMKLLEPESEAYYSEAVMDQTLHIPGAPHLGGRCKVR